ncbi:formin-binding protein 1-like isoform X12 [Myxocyprinus asiaticus]|uniref:formin-binding protein 1-like isoform X12 n=1 Tax=Myxocyprinus asiaticus TaxID=70543 RepID=UPI00222158FB|nr:formin-binding protein 1-like isoform X12 [Myxocyprinus asiaticus]
MVEEKMGGCWSQTKDQFDNLEKHTQWGIDFVEKYTKFVKERSEIELNYARQIRNLSKKYQPKKKEEDENKYTWCRAFHSTLNELNDYAGQHEVIAENMTSQIIAELSRYTQELKTERKTHFHDGRKAQQQVEASWKQLEACKRKFERDCKEADRAQQYFEKLDADINVTKADVEKARQQAQMRHQMASDSKSEYSSYLQKFNQEQNEHYYTIIPSIFQKIQVMEEKRIDRVGDSLKTFAEVDRQILPIIGKCLDGITQAAESIESKTDSSQVIESYKSGFEPPGDVEFEDYGQAMKRTVSETSLTNSRSDIKSERSSKSKSKTLWPFIKKNKGSNPEDFSNLPPEQRRKKLQAKIDDINKDIQKEMDQRDALTKMKEVYVKNPQMGDPTSVDPRLAEIAQNIEKLQAEAQKFEGWLAEVEGRMPVKSDLQRRTSALYETQNSTPPTNNNCAQDRESPDGSYTDEQSSEVQTKAQPEPPEFDEFDDADEEILSTIGTCKALYPFEGHNEGTISVTEGELLYVIEEDKGDGWTRVRRNEEEEGYVPTSYVEVFLDSNAKELFSWRRVYLSEDS